MPYFSFKNRGKSRADRIMACAVLTLLLLSANPLPVLAGETDMAGFVENATFYRDDRGLSKFRNTAQLEIAKDLENAFNASSVSLNATFRATYDGVYDLNDDDWGDNAGGPIMLQNGDGTFGPLFVPHGGGLSFLRDGVPTGFPPTLGFPPSTDFTPFFGSPESPNAMFGLPNVISLPNPNAGLEVLSGQLGAQQGGVFFGVPVRPCNVDPRGCTSLDGYMDGTHSDLAWSDFNDRWDFIREFYLNAAYDLDNDRQFGVKIGKQQIVWGRTDLFRVLDVLNPVDFSRNNIYDELEDIRIPMWMAEFEYRWGATSVFDDINLSAVWNFDKFRPHNLGQAGQPYQILDVGSFFRGFANCWENGCTVANFPVPGPPGVGGIAGLGAIDFGPGVIGIRDVQMPDWSLSNTQYGLKMEGILKDVGFSLNFLKTRSQLPSLRGIVPSIDPFMPFVIDDYDYALAFDIHFPRVTLIGGSLDLYSDPIKSAFRIEVAHTSGEEFPDTSVPDLFSESAVVRWVVGWDRATFIPFLNKRRAFLLSAQVFGQHLLDHNEFLGAANPALPPPGLIGMPDHKNNYIFTFLMQGWYLNDRLNPQIILAHDFEAGHTTIAPAIEWLLDDHWQFTLRVNWKVNDGVSTWDDDRSAIPYPGLSYALTGGATGALAGSPPNGSLRGVNPLGRFRDGPLGMAQMEDEIQMTIRYRF